MALALAVEEREERVTHGFHTYPAGLHPDAARDLLALFPGQRVLDPFCGGGTVLVEGLLAGRVVEGRDLGPTALRVARARTAVVSDEVLTAVRSASRSLAAAGRAVRHPAPPGVEQALGEWYAPHVLAELWAIGSAMEAGDGVVRDLLRVVFSSIVVKTSWRASDTQARREEHHRPPGTASVLFHKKARELARRLVALRELVPEGTPPASIRAGDARKLDVEPVDLILTSPPYPGVYDYLELQHLRNLWFDDDVPAMDEIGSRRSWREAPREALTQWRRDTEAWMTAAAAKLLPGGALVVVIGDGLTPHGAIDAYSPTHDAAAAVGLREVARASLERPDHARDASRWEHVVAFRR